MSNKTLKQMELVSDSPIENDHGIVKSKRKYKKTLTTQDGRTKRI
jgi:hypothetical protein